MIDYVVSACLLGIPCRYDGRSNFCLPVYKLKEAGRVLAVCPEVLGGLSVPRLPCERKGELVICRDGQDLTGAFLLGVEKALTLSIDSGATKAIVKSRSPSCGCGTIYDGSFSHILTGGYGLWTEGLLRVGFSVVTEEHFFPENALTPVSLPDYYPAFGQK